MTKPSTEVEATPRAVARRRRRASDDEVPGRDRWLVSYADFISLLFAFFVVMYAVSSVNSGRYRTLSDALSDAFAGPGHRDPTTRASIVQPLAPLVLPYARPPEPRHDHAAAERARTEALARRVNAALAGLIQKGQVRISTTSRGVAIDINAAVLFGQGQSTLAPEAEPTLKEVAGLLASLDNDVQIEGHTDDLPIKTEQFPSNWELSAARAGAVVRYLVATGIAAPRLSAAGYGEFRPVEPNVTAAGRARNRRVTVEILTGSSPEAP